MSSASAGISAAMNRMTEVASKAASGDSDIAGDAVSMAEAKAQLGANVAVVRTSSQMMGTLLDMLA